MLKRFIFKYINNLFVPSEITQHILRQQRSASHNNAIINTVFYLNKVQTTVIINMNWTNKDGITTATASGLQTVIQNKKSKSNIKEDLIAYGGGYLTEYNSSLNQLPKDEEEEAQEEEQDDEVETHTLEKKTQRGPDESDVLKRILDYISSEIRVTEG